MSVLHLRWWFGIPVFQGESKISLRYFEVYAGYAMSAGISFYAQKQHSFVRTTASDGWIPGVVLQKPAMIWTKFWSGGAILPRRQYSNAVGGIILDFCTLSEVLFSGNNSRFSCNICSTCWQTSQELVKCITDAGLLKLWRALSQVSLSPCLAYSNEVSIWRGFLLMIGSTTLKDCWS